MSTIDETGRRWQFSIRHLLVLTAIAAVVITAPTMILGFLIVILSLLIAFALVLPVVIVVMTLASVVCDWVRNWVVPLFLRNCQRA